MVAEAKTEAGYSDTFQAPAAQKVESGEAKKLTVCFVCTGNTCRSPMAEAVLNALGGELGYAACSAGLSAQPGAPISVNAVLALREKGIEATAENDYPHHTARVVDRALLEKCDRIVGISASHAMSLMALYPACATKIGAMPRDISDPYGGDPATYRRCLDEIIEGIRTLFLLGDNGGKGEKKED